MVNTKSTIINIAMNTPYNFSNTCKKKTIKSVNVIIVSALLFLVNTRDCRAKPTMSFVFPTAFSSFSPMSNLAQFVGATDRHDEVETAAKSYSGVRIRNDTLRMVYFHDQTIAVAELGAKKLLLNCELIEIYNDDDGKQLMRELSRQVNKPLGIGFMEMVKLMSQCQEVDSPDKTRRSTQAAPTKASGQYVSELGNRGLLSNSPLTLFSGIIPGTKWCGTGDIATTYHDLGAQSKMDKCCRTHDLCPVKVRAYQHRYNLTNNSLYTKSHCLCDDMLYTCLKETNTSASQVMGNIYFNLVQVPCVQDTPSGRKYKAARKGF